MHTSAVVVNIKDADCQPLESHNRQGNVYSDKTVSNNDKNTEGGRNRQTGGWGQTAAVISSPQESHGRLRASFKTCSFHTAWTRVGKYSWPNTAPAINPEPEPRSCQETKQARNNCLFRHFLTEAWHLRAELAETEILFSSTRRWQHREQQMIYDFWGK